MVFEIHYLDGEQGQRLSVVQAKAMRDVLDWIARNRQSEAAPATPADTDQSIDPVEADPEPQTDLHPPEYGGRYPDH